MRLDAPRAAVAAQRLGSGIPLLARQGPPAAHARGTHPEPLPHLPVAGARRHRRQHTAANTRSLTSSDNALDTPTGLLTQQAC